jgi:hypothetical protein
MTLRERHSLLESIDALLRAEEAIPSEPPTLPTHQQRPPRQKES